MKKPHLAPRRPPAAAHDCEGKERFANFERAQSVARRMKRNRARAMRAYSCRHCGGFHVGGSRPSSGAGV